VQLAGLLHDASEAYVTDIPSPLKSTPELWGFRKIEDRILQVVAHKWNLPWPIPEEVKIADRVEQLTEAMALHPLGSAKWEGNGIFRGLGPRSEPLFPMNPKEAEKVYLVLFRELTK